MNFCMFCKTAPLAAAVALGGLAFTAPASAAPEDELTIYSPYKVKRERSGSLSGDNISVSRRVSYSHLDLRYAGDINRLQRDVEYAAVDVCAEANRLSRVSFSAADSRECYRDAVTDARRQVNRAVARANYRY